MCAGALGWWLAPLPFMIFLSFLHVRGGPRMVVSTATFHATVQGSFPGLGNFIETPLQSHISVTRDNVRPARRIIRSGCGLKLKGTGFESWVECLSSGLRIYSAPNCSRTWIVQWCLLSCALEKKVIR